MKQIQLTAGMKITVRYMSRGLLVPLPGREPAIVPIAADDPKWTSKDIVPSLASFTGHVVHATYDYIVLRLANGRAVAILHNSVKGVEILENVVNNNVLDLQPKV